MINDDILQKFADYFNVNIDMLKNMEEDIAKKIVNNTYESGSINNTFEEGSNGNIHQGDGDQVINNPLEKVIQLIKERDALLQQIIEKNQEYEQLLLAALEKTIKKDKK